MRESFGGAAESARNSKVSRRGNGTGSNFRPFQEIAVLVQVSPLNAVNKRGTSEKWVILDLSYLQGGSINDGIEKKQYLGSSAELQYPSVDDFASLINRKGAGCLMFKRDLKRAYQQIPIDPGYVHKLCYVWEENLYADRMLPMGLSSAAYVCQRTTSAVAFMYKEEGYDAVVFLDDFGGAEIPAKAQEAEDALDGLLDDVGLDQAHKKKKRGATRMPYLGVLFDSQKLTMEVEPERLAELRELFQVWMGKSVATRKELESLAGKLNFVAKCVRPGRAFMNRMYDVLGEWDHADNR